MFRRTQTRSDGAVSLNCYTPAPPFTLLVNDKYLRWNNHRYCPLTISLTRHALSPRWWEQDGNHSNNSTVSLEYSSLDSLIQSEPLFRMISHGDVESCPTFDCWIEQDSNPTSDSRLETSTLKRNRESTASLRLSIFIKHANSKSKGMNGRYSN